MPFFQKNLLPYYIVLGLICILCRNHIFFWDTYQLCGKQAWALYENGIFHWVLPPDIDSGHPPLFGFYHAVLWKLFQPSLVVSHLAMFPFLCGIIYFFFHLGSHYLDEAKTLFLLPLLLVDPVFMGQAVLVSPDIVLICCMLMCWLGIVQQSNNYIVFGAIGLGMISMRGMMVLAALMLFDFVVLQNNKAWKVRLVKMTRYIPAVGLVIVFLIFHHLKTGWLGYHKNSSWAESFEYVDFMGGLRNIAVYIWRTIDFGRLFLVISVMCLAYKWWPRQKLKKSKEIISLLVLLILIISPILLVHKGLVLHRYLLPIFLVLSLLFWYNLFSVELDNKLRKRIWGLVMIGMISGNLWVYPKQISQGWDATLGHLPYYSLRDQMINYLDRQHISLSKVGTAFPNIGPLKYYNPCNNQEGFKNYNLDQDNYIFYSNIFNDFSDKELNRLASFEWIVEKRFYFYPVEIILYKKNK
jgi:hypothetical protein